MRIITRKTGRWIVGCALALCVAAVPAAAGETVKASDYGFNRDDATDALQAAIDSGAAVVRVDNTGAEWLVRPIMLRSNLELIFEDGVVVRALPGAYLKTNEFLFEARDAVDLTLRGEGTARLVMNKADYQDTTRYVHSEWRHTLTFRGCERVAVRDLTLEASGGDGIYLARGQRLKGCRDVRIENVIVRDHHRQGISVISAEKLLVKNCEFSNTSGTPPAAGLDIEPNRPDEWVVDCVFEDCQFLNNAGAGIVLHLSPLNAESRPVSVTFRRCVMTGNSSNFHITLAENSPVTGEIVLEDSEMSGARFNSVVIREPAEGMAVTIRRTAIDNRGAKSPAVMMTKLRPDNARGPVFEDVTLRAGDFPPLSFGSLSGAALTGLSGTLYLVNAAGGRTAVDLAAFAAQHPGNPELREFTVRPVNLKALRPRNPGAATLDSQPGYWLRGHQVQVLQYVEAGKPVTLQFAAQKVSKWPIKIEVAVRDANGTPHSSFVITEETHEHTFEPKVSETLTLEFKTNGNIVALRNAPPGQAIRADVRTGLFKGRRKYYFLVPAGAKSILAEVAPEVNEPASSELLGPDGKAVASFASSSDPQRLSHQRADTAKDEVWCLSLPYIREDVRVRIGGDAIPLLSMDPQSLLVETPQ